MSNTSHHDKQSFGELIKANFGFVESQFGMRFENVRASGGNNPRDVALMARYSGSAFRFDIGWNEFELSLAVLIKFNKGDLSLYERYVYFESFVEFATDGKEAAIAPYIAENMCIRQIQSVIQKRRSVFRNGLAPVVKQVARKLQFHFEVLINASPEQVRAYHQWMSAKR